MSLSLSLRIRLHSSLANKQIFGDLLVVLPCDMNMFTNVCFRKKDVFACCLGKMFFMSLKLHP